MPPLRSARNPCGRRLSPCCLPGDRVHRERVLGLLNDRLRASSSALRRTAPAAELPLTADWSRGAMGGDASIINGNGHLRPVMFDLCTAVQQPQHLWISPVGCSAQRGKGGAMGCKPIAGDTSGAEHPAGLISRQFAPRGPTPPSPPPKPSAPHTPRASPPPCVPTGQTAIRPWSPPSTRRPAPWCHVGLR